MAVVEPWPARGWRFLRVPDAPRATHPWGRTPVRATVGGVTWDTSTWGNRSFGTVLMLPPSIAAELGAEVSVELLPRVLDEAPTRRRRARSG